MVGQARADAIRMAREMAPALQLLNHQEGDGFSVRQDYKSLVYEQ